MKLMKGLALSTATGGVLDPGLRGETLAQRGVLPGRLKHVDQLLADSRCRVQEGGSGIRGDREGVGPDKYDPQDELPSCNRRLPPSRPAFLISVADAAVLQPGINAAVDAGIPVITVDSDAAGSRRLYFIGTNNLEAGRLGGRRVVEKLGGKGNVVFFTIAGQPNTEERLKGFKDAFAARPGIKIVEVVDIKGDTGVAFDRTQQLLAQTGAKKIDAFICLDSASGKMVADAVKRSHDASPHGGGVGRESRYAGGNQGRGDRRDDCAEALHDGLRRPQGARRDLSRSARAAQQGLQFRTRSRLTRCLSTPAPRWWIRATWIFIWRRRRRTPSNKAPTGERTGNSPEKQTAASPKWTGRRKLWCASAVRLLRLGLRLQSVIFLGQLDARAFELLLHLGHVAGLVIGRQRL